MSQYGARGRALAGQDAPTILAHYYQGTRLSTMDPAARIRVLLVSNALPSRSYPARVHGRSGPWRIDHQRAIFPAGAYVSLLRSPTSTGGWRIVVTAPDRKTLLDVPSAGDLRIRPTGPGSRLQVGLVRSTYNLYRGNIRMIGSPAGRVTVINELPIDLYLLGVVPAEMPWAWPTQALAAQAIASRSFAARRLRTTGRFDIANTSGAQIYRGVRAERSTTTAAVTATAGQILSRGGYAANTLYHSTGGGATENNEFAFVRSDGTLGAVPVAYLRGSPDRAADGTPFDASSPYAAWRTATYSSAQLSAIMGADARTRVGTIRVLDMTRRGVSGRVVAVTMIGTTGRRTVSGELFRAIFNTHRPPGTPWLRSTLFDIAPLS